MYLQRRRLEISAVEEQRPWNRRVDWGKEPESQGVGDWRSARCGAASFLRAPRQARRAHKRRGPPAVAALAWSTPRSRHCHAVPKISNFPHRWRRAIISSDHAFHLAPAAQNGDHASRGALSTAGDRGPGLLAGVGIGVGATIRSHTGLVHVAASRRLSYTVGIGVLAAKIVQGDSRRRPGNRPRAPSCGFR